MDLPLSPHQGSDHPAPGDISRSLIIITRRRDALLETTLASVAAQTLSFDEVVVVDNAGDEATAAVCARWADRLALRYGVETAEGYSLARNAGLRLAHGQLIYFLDDDCPAAPDWAERLTRPILSGEADLVGGARWPGEHSWVHRLEYLSTDGPSLHPSLAGGPAAHLSTSNLVVRREVVDKVGEFTPGLTMCEDRDFTLRARLAGFRLRFEPSARVWHHPPIDGFRGYLAKMRHYGQGTSQHFLRWPNAEPLAWLFPRRPLARAVALPALAALGTAYLIKGNLPHRPDVLAFAPLLAIGQIWWHLGGVDATRGPRPDVAQPASPSRT